jgi:nucleoside 2-deoxyribosyltransferase
MKKRLVYLSGMMDGVSIAEGDGWRKIAHKYLEERGMDSYNPYDGTPNDETTTANQVFHKDIYYLEKSDLVLVNLDLPPVIKNKDIPFFTIGEIFLAHRDRKPVISYTNCLKGRHGYEAIVTRTLPDLESCLEFIIENY